MKNRRSIIVMGVVIILLAVDQLLKVWVLSVLPGTVDSMPVIPGLLQLTYVENRGAAFGIFQGGVIPLSILTGVVIVGAVVMLFMGKFQKKIVLACVALIVAGGAGNLIDRIFRGFVVDYLDISPLFRFPVFNFADCCVVAGTLLLLVYLLFFEEQEIKKKTEELAESQKDIKNDEEQSGENQIG